MLSLSSRYRLGRVSPINTHIHTYADYSGPTALAVKDDDEPLESDMGFGQSHRKTLMATLAQEGIKPKGFLPRSMHHHPKEK
jgi:hypothetical protein